MANASKKHVGPGTQGKKSRTGGTTELPKNLVEDNMIRSNRDKSSHSGERGLDGESVQTEQYQDHVAHQLSHADKEAE